MGLHKCLLSLRDSPLDVEEDFRSGIRFYCESLWQKASVGIRGHYGEYEMTTEAFALKCKERKNSFHRTYDSLEHARHLVKMLMQGFETASSDRSLSDSKYIDAALQHASIVSCMLGGRSSLGDIEFFMSLCQVLAVQKIRRPTPRTMLREFRKGNSKPLICHLYRLWEDSADELLSLAEEEDIESLFLYEKNSMVPVLKCSILSTNFYLSASLLSYFLPSEGNG